jgi:large subunit ribosomal protein L4
MIALALRSALSDRAADGKVVVLDAWDFEKPSTKSAIAALASLGIEGRALLVLAEDDQAAWKSVRNLREVHPILVRELNAYDVLVADWVVFTRETLPTSAEKPAETEVEIS